MKVGRWLVKFRVSGPEARRADIEATMDALLSSIRFEGTAQPRPATPLNIGGCDAASNTNARPFTEPTAAFGAALILPFDPMGEPGATGRDGRPLNILSRVGDAWCLSTVARYGQSQTPILRAVGPERADGGRNAPVRSVGLALISDSGIILEIVQDQGHYTLIYHRIGESMVLGSYVTPPSDEQLVNLLSGADQEAGRIQARVGLSADGNSEISLSAPPANNQRR
jgi:hypothetical protein